MSQSNRSLHSHHMLSFLLWEHCACTDCRLPIPLVIKFYFYFSIYLRDWKLYCIFLWAVSNPERKRARNNSFASLSGLMLSLLLSCWWGNKGDRKNWAGQLVAGREAASERLSWLRCVQQHVPRVPAVSGQRLLLLPSSATAQCFSRNELFSAQSCCGQDGSALLHSYP